jgi:predicted Zn-dependent protease
MLRLWGHSFGLFNSMSYLNRRRRTQPHPSVEEQVQELRQRCRGPRQWEGVSDSELNAMHERARRLRAEGYGSDSDYVSWLSLVGRK